MSKSTLCYGKICQKYLVLKVAPNLVHALTHSCSIHFSKVVLLNKMKGGCKKSNRANLNKNISKKKKFFEKNCQKCLPLLNLHVLLKISPRPHVNEVRLVSPSANLFVRTLPSQ